MTDQRAALRPWHQIRADDLVAFALLDQLGRGDLMRVVDALDDLLGADPILEGEVWGLDRPGERGRDYHEILRGEPYD